METRTVPLSRGFEVSPLNQQKLFGANYGTEEERRKQGERVASEYVRQIGDTNIFELNDDTTIFELDDKVKKSFLSTPERELKRLFLFVLDHSTQVRFSFAGKAPDEPWIAAFCAAVVDTAAQPIADSVTRIAIECLKSVDQKKLAAVQEKSEATRTRREAAKNAVAERYGSGGFGPHPLPDSRSSVAKKAGYTFDDFDEDGELLPDSDCEDVDAVQSWQRKRERYCHFMDEKGHELDLKGCDPADLYHGKRLVVYYDECGDDRTKNVAYPAKVVGGLGRDKDGKPALLALFENGDELHVTDADEWHWDEEHPYHACARGAAN